MLYICQKGRDNKVSRPTVQWTISQKCVLDNQIEKLNPVYCQNILQILTFIA